MDDAEWKKIRTFATDLVILEKGSSRHRLMSSSFLEVKRESGASPGQSRCCKLYAKPTPLEKSHCVAASHTGRRGHGE
jgi:hypothetical protein